MTAADRLVAEGGFETLMTEYSAAAVEEVTAAERSAAAVATEIHAVHINLLHQ